MQSELFELSTPKVQAEPVSLKPTFLERTAFTLRLDQAIGLVLVLLVFYVLAFSWGVEQGKRLSFETRPSKPTAVAIETVAAPVAPVAKVNDAAVTEMPVLISELPKTVAAVAKPVGTPVGKYTIQYVTYVTQSAADREVQRITKLGRTAFVIPSGKHFQVCIEAFQSRHEASQILKQLKSQHTVSMDAYVRDIPA